MSEATGFLTSSGYNRLSLKGENERGEKVRLYHLEKTDQMAVNVAKIAISKEIQIKNRQFSSLVSFEKDVQTSPYLLKEGEALRLLRREEAEEIERKYQEFSSSPTSFGLGSLSSSEMKEKTCDQTENILTDEEIQAIIGCDISWPTDGQYKINTMRLWLVHFKAFTNTVGANVFNLLYSPEPNKTIYETKAYQVMLHFSLLFEQGRALMNSPPREGGFSLSDGRMTIRSPRSLLDANLDIMNQAEQAIFAQLLPLTPEETPELLRLRFTQTTFLDPIILSRMTGNGISIDKALLLITCLGLQKNQTRLPVCDPLTGNFSSHFQDNMLTCKQPYKLFFFDPNQMKKPESKCSQINDLKNSRLLFEKTKSICSAIIRHLRDLFSALFTPLSIRTEIVKELIQASEDHKVLYDALNNLERRFSNDQKELFLQCKSLILSEVQPVYNECEKIAEKLATQKQIDDEVKVVEANARIRAAIQDQKSLEELFNSYKNVIFSFLKISSKKYQIANPMSYTIRWNIQGIEIEETLEITKTCAITRRVLCPEIAENNRRDLVYFSSNGEEDSVVSQWKVLCEKHGLSDRELANILLSLYSGEDCHKDFKPFLSFLIVLLLGKEPSYDAASFAANFIMLFSVKLGLYTFEEALKEMPLIPQGAIAAKQFLLHVRGIPLDASARVQYKDKTSVPESSFLPIATAFMGSAHVWIRKYSDVAKTAKLCCRHLFLKDLDLNHTALQQLLNDLKELLKRDSLDIWGVPVELHPFSERRKIFTQSTDEVEKAFIPVYSDLLKKKNEYAAKFLNALGHTIDDLDNAAEQCAKFLMRGIKLFNPRIQELQKIIDEHDRQKWIGNMLSSVEEDELKRNPQLYKAMMEMVKNWDPSAEFCKNGIPMYDYSNEMIKQMNKVWDSYFTQTMSSYSRDKEFDKLRADTLRKYRVPVPFYCFASWLTPITEVGIVNNADPVTQWAISYILDSHPLNY